MENKGVKYHQQRYYYYYSLFSIELYTNVSVFNLKKTLHCLQSINVIYAFSFMPAKKDVNYATMPSK